MIVKNKKPPQSARTQGANNKSVSKNNTILNALVETPLTRFDAEGLGDHCLNSTISALSSQHGLSFLEGGLRFQIALVVKPFVRNTQLVMMTSSRLINSWRC